KEYTSLSKWMILWLLTLLLSHRNVMTSLVFTEKRLKSVAIMGAIAMILAITAYIVFIPKFGIGGVVIGFTIHELTHTIFYYLYFIPRKFQINTKSLFFHSVLPAWLVLGMACILVALGSLFIHCSVWLTAILKVCVLGFLMIVLVWHVLLNKNDKKFLLSFIQLKRQ
ncbi:MAG: polysaccharide biosynthesis C-terminal domain-containing protein, partial [Erysipelotrichales bacterium]|nr:polysaccharide biosynthesis C-terminal domain-containing protein [Erysipelotrichales bacterium]